MKRAAAAIACALIVAGALAAAGATRVALKGGARIDVTLKDAGGRPIAGAVVRLVEETRFFGKNRSALLARARTGRQGTARLTYAPAHEGTVVAAVVFEGGPGYAPSRVPITFDVNGPIRSYVPPPVGISSWWTHGWTILVAVGSIWIVYARIFLNVRALRRAGLAAVAPALRADPAAEHAAIVLDHLVSTTNGRRSRRPAHTEGEGDETRSRTSTRRDGIPRARAPGGAVARSDRHLHGGHTESATGRRR